MLRAASVLRPQRRALLRGATRVVSTTPASAAYEKHPGKKAHEDGQQEGHDYLLMHPVYTEDELEVEVTHRQPTTLGDKTAYGAMRTMRVLFDLMTGYGGQMNEAQYLRRILFLETVAGVPGMVGAMVRGRAPPEMGCFRWCLSRS